MKRASAVLADRLFTFIALLHLIAPATASAIGALLSDQSSVLGVYTLCGADAKTR